MSDQPALPFDWSNVYDLTGRLASRADLNALLDRDDDDLADAKRAALHRLVHHHRRPTETVDTRGLL